MCGLRARLSGFCELFRKTKRCGKKRVTEPAFELLVFFAVNGLLARTFG
jgi:hypothetical protein